MSLNILSCKRQRPEEAEQNYLMEPVNYTNSHQSWLTRLPGFNYAAVNKICFIGSFYITDYYIQKLPIVKLIFIIDEEYLLALNYLLNEVCFGLSKLMDIVSTDILQRTTCPRSAE